VKAPTIQWIDDYLDSFGITQEIGPPLAYDGKHHYYVQMGLRGEVAQGDADLFAATERDAERVYWQSLRAYLEHGHYKHILWRTRPEMQSMTVRRTGKGARLMGPMTLWCVYSRLIGYGSAEDAKP